MNKGMRVPIEELPESVAAVIKLMFNIRTVYAPPLSRERIKLYKWLAMDWDGHWYLYDMKPELDTTEGDWSTARGRGDPIAFISLGKAVHECTDYAKSLTEL